MPPSVTVSTTIPRPVEVVFDFVADSRNDADWSPTVASVEQIEGEGPGVGAVYRIGQVMPRGVVPLDLHTTAYERPTRLEWSMTGPAMRYASVMEFRPDEDGTRIRQTNTVATGSRLQDAAWFAMAQVAMRRQFAGLRKHLLAD